jgi:Uma2 family endonuclease
MAIDIYHKKDAGDWLILSYRSGDSVELQSIGLTVSLAQFYEDIVFEPSPDELQLEIPETRS